MPPYNSILASNKLINDATCPLISVFVGGTSGIGKFTIKALVATGTSLRIYIIGRNTAYERTQLFIQEQQTVNPEAEIIWIEGEIALLADVERVCGIIKAKEKNIDLLFLTAGYAPFGPREETVEGVEVAQSLEYYSRVLFILHLLPLLHSGKGARVVSVLGGGLERTNIDLEDLDLKKPGNFSSIKAQPQYGAMGTMTLDKLASENPGVTFIHSWPGFVNTGNVRRGNQGWIHQWLVWLLLEPIIRLFSMSDEFSGQRNLFLATSAAFGCRGVRWDGKPGVNSRGEEADGLFLVNYKCDCTPNQKAVSSLRKTTQKKIWEHTQDVLGPYL